MRRPGCRCGSRGCSFCCFLLVIVGVFVLAWRAAKKKHLGLLFDPIVPNSMITIDQQYPIRTTLIISRVSNTIHIHTPKRAQTEFPLPHSQTPPQLWVQHLCWVRLKMAAYHRRVYREPGDSQVSWILCVKIYTSLYLYHYITLLFPALIGFRGSSVTDYKDGKGMERWAIDVGKLWVHIWVAGLNRPQSQLILRPVPKKDLLQPHFCGSHDKSV